MKQSLPQVLELPSGTAAGLCSQLDTFLIPGVVILLSINNDVRD